MLCCFFFKKDVYEIPYKIKAIVNIGVSKSLLVEK